MFRIQFLVRTTDCATRFVQLCIVKLTDSIDDLLCIGDEIYDCLRFIPVQRPYLLSIYCWCGWFALVNGTFMYSFIVDLSCFYAFNSISRPNFLRSYLVHSRTSGFSSQLGDIFCLVRNQNLSMMFRGTVQDSFIAGSTNSLPALLTWPSNSSSNFLSFLLSSTYFLLGLLLSYYSFYYL